MVFSGRVVESGKKGLEFATAALLNPADSALIESTLTDSNGVFSFSNINRGEYYLKIILVGYNQYNALIKADSSTVLLPEIILASGTINLNEISITTLKKLIEVKNGNITVNITDSPLSQGNSAFDLVSKLPGVTVDENNTIAIQGRDGVKILIDDRVQQLSGAQLINLLKSMSATNIEKIEVLKNPPLKYDAAGIGGLINIRTKKVKLHGFSGSVNYNFSQGFYAYHSGDVSLNYRNRKIVLYSTFTADRQITFHDHRFYNKVKHDTTITILDQKMANIDGGYYFGGRAGLDWLVNKKNTIGFKFNADGGEGFEKNVGNNFISNNDLGFTQLRFNSYNLNPWQYSNLNIYAEHLFDTLGSKLVFTSDYSPNFDLYQGAFDNWFLSNNGDETAQPLYYISSNVIKNDIYSSKLDYTKIIKSSIVLECGAKVTLSELSSDYDMHVKDNSTGNYILDTSYTNAFEYNEKIIAGYLNFTKNWERINIQGGVRAENTQIHAQNRTQSVVYRREYFNLFPAINITYTSNEKSNYQFSYNQRIDRPDYNSFNPFKNRSSVFMSNKGNPNLLPEYSNTFELSHNFKDIFSQSFSCSLIDHFMIDLTLQNDSSKETTAYIDNLNNAYKYGYTLFFHNAIKKWWTVTFNASASYLTCEGQLIGQEYKSNGYFYIASLTNEFLIKQAKFEFNAKYIGPRFNGIWKNGPRWGISFALKKSFLKEKLDVMVGLDDVFFTMIGSNNMKVQEQEWRITATNDSRRIKVGLSFNFGKIKVEEREISSNDEEKGRLGK